MISNLNNGGYMDNILLKKLWEDDGFIELFIVAESEYIKANQTCYIDEKDFIKNINIMEKYINNFKERCYIEFGKKDGNFTPAFSMNIFPADLSGKIKIEMDLEIDDIADRTHRCKFFVSTELGQLEKFITRLKKINIISDDFEISLN